MLQPQKGSAKQGLKVDRGGYSLDISTIPVLLQDARWWWWTSSTGRWQVSIQLTGLQVIQHSFCINLCPSPTRRYPLLSVGDRSTQEKPSSPATHTVAFRCAFRCVPFHPPAVPRDMLRPLLHRMEFDRLAHGRPGTWDPLSCRAACSWCEAKSVCISTGWGEVCRDRHAAAASLSQQHANASSCI